MIKKLPLRLVAVSLLAPVALGSLQNAAAQVSHKTKRTTAHKQKKIKVEEFLPAPEKFELKFEDYLEKIKKSALFFSHDNSNFGRIDDGENGHGEKNPYYFITKGPTGKLQAIMITLHSAIIQPGPKSALEHDDISKKVPRVASLQYIFKDFNTFEFASNVIRLGVVQAQDKGRQSGTIGIWETFDVQILGYPDQLEAASKKIKSALIAEPPMVLPKESKSNTKQNEYRL